MKKSLMAVVVLLSVVGADSAFAQQAGQHGVFKTTVTLPVVRVDTSGAVVDKLVTKTLAGNDLVNLYLGRPLGTKVDPTVDGILALDVTFEDSGSNTPKSRLVLYDPLVGGQAGIKQTLGAPTEIQFDTAYLGSTTKGFGTGTGAFSATPNGNGDPTKNAIVASALTVAGSGAGPHIEAKQAGTTTSSAATLVGTFHFLFTDKTGVTTDWNGFVLKGTATVTGKQMGNYIEN